MEKREQQVVKQSIRAAFLNNRNALTLKERQEKSRTIWEYLKKTKAYEQAQAVLVYMDYRSEVMTTGLVEELLFEKEKKVFAPRVEGFVIRFYEIGSLDELQEGYQGIREPEEKESGRFTLQMMTQQKSLVLVPGAVFDRSRGRMGYGKGFYDRFLAEYTELMSVGLAFDCQLAKKIPMQEHDVRPQMLITESGIIL